MSSYPYKKIDAFTSHFSSGNPAACLYLEKGRPLADKDMLAVAREHEGFVSEMVFCTPVEDAHYHLRYYSSECEVAFCGHGTIACMYDLIANDPMLLQKPEITITTSKGSLKVYNEISTSDAVFITAPGKVELPVKPHMDAVAQHLAISKSEIRKDLNVECIDAGLRTLIVPIASLGTVLAMHPDEAALKQFCIDSEVDIILVFSSEVACSQNIMRTRVFAPRFGYLEDPATGSGNSAFGYYMLKNSLWDGSAVSIEQNAEKTAFNVVKLKETAGKVLFGGSATIRIEGRYLL
ncbi:PhzF family phenazine biosynthesis protein [Desulfovibrio desulfuricans]|uniref:PhzF family phenazine biosynthesis protein n=1 Tax=Desulfovibrio desulfuricans TaxID=876 RepID=UPI001F3BB814|nr:PhzF family phenazine biosynthesis protein [Desulfovibrio desulfuricans]UIA99082.1 PhzF family phenazine biosynthesis protein [Desulfovibrio desulfuricans]